MSITILNAMAYMGIYYSSHSILRMFEIFHNIKKKKKPVNSI